jgi:hypothetical protein
VGQNSVVESSDRDDAVVFCGKPGDVVVDGHAHETIDARLRNTSNELASIPAL